MSKKLVPSHREGGSGAAVSVPKSKTAHGLARREVLQAGLLGLAGAAVGARPAEARPAEARPAEARPAPAECPTPTKCPTPPPPPEPCRAPARTPTPLECLPLDLQGARENWNEPWIWRPSDWPNDQLDLQVVENQNPGIEVGLGNPGSVFFSYGGNTPGPTIRMRGDETLYVKLRNLLGEDCGQTFVGPFPELSQLPDCARQEKRVIEKGKRRGQLRFDFCLGEHTNGIHSTHVTNLHTHGLHVRPDKNPDGSNSDNVILRLITQEDFKRRERAVFDQDPTCVCGQKTKAERCESCGADIAPTPPCPDDVDIPDDVSACRFLEELSEDNFVRDDELVGEADYEFRLGNLPDFPVHPPGTHWYHPHAHGATDVQVSSGMAGYLIVEGDVDARINCALTGSENPDPTRKTGPWDYRERLMFMQRIFPGNIEGDPQSPKNQLKKRPTPTANGSEKAGVINMRPGAIERWRVLNGSVDGRGFKHFMVLEGQYEVITTGFQPDGAPIAPLFRIDDRTLEPTEITFGNYQQLVEDQKQQLWQLAIDGVTLVRENEGGPPTYFIKDLAEQNAGSVNPLTRPCERDIPKGLPNAEKLCRIESIFADCESVRAAWVRPNEYYMGPANRTDVFFQLPLTAKCGDVFTVLAIASVIHADTPVFNLQKKVADPEPAPGPVSIIVAHIVVVDEQPVEGVTAAGGYRGAKHTDTVTGLERCLPPVPKYLYPVTADELRDGEKFRSRVVNYSGWGNDGLPLVTTADGPGNPSAAGFRSFIHDTKEGKALRDLRYIEHDGTEVLLPPRIRTMSINGRKFNPNDPERAQVAVNTCEQWVVYNNTQTLWAHTDVAKHPQRGQYQGHYVSYAIDRATGEKVFWHQEGLFDYDPTCSVPPDFRIVTRGIDHPFHIHQNPFWVLRIEIPDKNGKLCNILDEPRWMDSLWIPRNNGRIVFRSRFPDFVGASVHHCHILQHEDNGMMTAFQLTPFPADANNELWDFAVEPIPPGHDDEELHRPTLEQSYTLNFTFVDPNFGKATDTGQTYPGFEVAAPRWPPDRES